MNLSALNGKRNELPDQGTVCEMILRLESPVNVMAWIMAESGCRLSDLQAMRVGDYSARDRFLGIASETGGHRESLSCGLRAALERYLVQLRTVFEARRRGMKVTARRIHLVKKFSDQRLFPSWALDVRERGPEDAVFPARVFVSELQAAAAAVSFSGPIHSNTLRLCCTRRWMEEGEEMASIHERLGHRDLLTTMLMVQALKSQGLAFTSAPVNKEAPQPAVA